MPFDKVTKINCAINNSNVPGRLYIHSSGKEIWEKVNPDYWLSAQTPNIPYEINPDFFIAIAWNNDYIPTADFVYWQGLMKSGKSWKTNPEIGSIVLERGTWKKNLDITCGDGIILLGEEEKFRRKTTNFEQYIKRGPHLNLINSDLAFDEEYFF